MKAEIRRFRLGADAPYVNPAEHVFYAHPQGRLQVFLETERQLGRFCIFAPGLIERLRGLGVHDSCNSSGLWSQ